jgi:predicted TIM-barrel fold metal-dependent hydrolase
MALAQVDSPAIPAAPLVDYHQHLFSPAITKLAPGLEPLSATELISLLDAAGIRKALILSVAYQFSNPNKPKVENEYEHVKAENDWTSRQVAQYPGRLRGFCAVNPLKDYALREIARCAKDPNLHFGLKLHFGNSDVDLNDPNNVKQVCRTLRAANKNRMAIVVHMRSSVTRKRRYGANEARIFLNHLLPCAPDVVVQIAHLAGAGTYDDPTVDEALAVFAEASTKADKRMAHVYFDVSGVVGYGQWEEKQTLLVTRIRQLGVDHILFGSDGARGGNLAPREAWSAFRRLPLTDAEFHTIKNNLLPFMK